MTMRVSLVLSLQHLCCTKIVSSFFNEVLPLIEVYCLKTSKLLEDSSPAINMDPHEIYNMIHSKIVHKIKCLTPCIPLQKKMEEFIGPMFCEIEKWLTICKNTWETSDYTLLTILKSIPKCWFFDGTVDREKSVKILIKNSDVNPVYRFVSACHFCLLEDIVDIWEILPHGVKINLKLHADSTVKHFIRWLESESEKDCRSFVSWTLAYPWRNRNIYILKCILNTLGSVGKSRYLSYVFIETSISCDIMRQGLSLMSEDEQHVIFKERPIAVFRCITSWPVRDRFLDIVDIFWPFLTEDTFCDILNMLMVELTLSDDGLLVIIKQFWAQSPLTFKTSANNNFIIYEPLQFVLKHDLNKPFPRREFNTRYIELLTDSDFAHFFKDMVQVLQTCFEIVH